MNMILHSVYDHAARHADRIALCSDQQDFSYSELAEWIAATGKQFHARPGNVIGLLMDNCPAWAVIDLASQYAGCTLVPLPAFFSDRQLCHIVRDAGVDMLVTDDPARLPQLDIEPVGEAFRFDIKGTVCHGLMTRPAVSPSLPPQTVKITYTSGSTGHPKGVCLDPHAIESVTQSLGETLAAEPTDRHLVLMPLSTLLENIGGLYVPLSQGGSAMLLPTGKLGTFPGRLPETGQILETARHHQCSSMTLTPELLKLIVQELETGTTVPASLRFVAVGGAPVSPRLLDRAVTLGLPVYQGYGLSECASVVAVNTPDQYRRGSVGKALPHCRISIADDGEILVGGPHFSAYLGQDQQAPETPWPTGDTGYVDRDGYLYVTGRKKNIVITSTGRNVSPEWIEQELTASPLIQRAFVFGNDQPQVCAVIWATRDTGSAGDRDRLEAVVESINRDLPAYARIGTWLPADTPPWQLKTATGLDRGRLEQHYLPAVRLQMTGKRAAAQ